MIFTIQTVKEFVHGYEIIAGLCDESDDYSNLLFIEFEKMRFKYNNKNGLFISAGTKLIRSDIQMLEKLDTYILILHELILKYLQENKKNSQKEIIIAALLTIKVQNSYSIHSQISTSNRSVMSEGCRVSTYYNVWLFFYYSNLYNAFYDSGSDSFYTEVNLYDLLSFDVPDANSINSKGNQFLIVQPFNELGFLIRLLYNLYLVKKLKQRLILHQHLWIHNYHIK